eukprot:Partr_v1_DN28355_c0_g1_i3_m78924
MDLNEKLIGAINGQQVTRSYADAVAACFGVYQAYLDWFQMTGPDNLELFSSIMMHMTNLSVGALQLQNQNAQIYNSASRILVSIGTVIKPDNFLDNQTVTEIIGNVHIITASFPDITKKNLYQLASKVCLANCGADSAEFHTFIKMVTDPFISQCSNPDFQRQDLSRQPTILSQLSQIFFALSAIMESIEGERNSIKIGAYVFVHETVPISAALFQVTNDAGLLRDIIEHFLILFRCSGNIMPIGTIELVFDKIFSRYSIGSVVSICQNNSKVDASSFRGIEKLLRIIVEDNSRKFEQFIPHIIDFVTYSITPAVYQTATEATEIIKDDFFDLCQCIISSKWKYFFPSQKHDPERLAKFDLIFNSLCKGLSLDNPNDFRTVLRLLSDLGKRCFLFRNEHFRANLLLPIVTNLCTAVVNQTHVSSLEEITALIFDMAAVGMHVFYQSVLAKYIENSPINDRQKEQLLNSLEILQDLPSFSNQLSTILKDLAYFSNQIK